MKELLAPLLFLVSLLPPVAAQQAGTAVSGAVHLQPIRQLRQDVDLWPLIAHPANSQELQINATLSQINQRLRQTMQECLGGEYAWPALDGKKAPHRADDYEFTNKVRVTMAGPRFLSLVADQGSYCGGAHPEGQTLAFVFDLTTGARVDWKSILPPAASTTPDTFDDGTQADAVLLPALDALNLAQAQSECRDAYQNPQPFLLWPDSKKAALVALPLGLSHADIPCATELDIPIDEARRVGFSPTLLDAVVLAHRQTDQR